MDTIIKFIVTVALAGVIIALLPASPFTSIIASLESLPYIGELNYFIPFGKIITITVAWAGSVGTYFVVSWVLRQLDIIGA